MAYRYVLLDFDHTLFDSDTSLELAFADAMEVVGADPAGRYPLFDAINGALWKRVEAGAMSAPEVHIARFEQLGSELELDAEPQVMADAFARGLADRGELYAGARASLGHLASVATLALVTNGLSQVQRARIERLDLGHYFAAIVISAEVGVAKPATGIFDLTLAKLDHPARADTIMVGDSPSSDIAGGNNAGLATCWYNPHGIDPSHPSTYQIDRLADLVPIVTGE